MNGDTKDFGFDPVEFYRTYPAGGNADRGDWLRRCLTAMCKNAYKIGYDTCTDHNEDSGPR